jgi:predicted amidohydrolase YtcJ
MKRFCLLITAALVLAAAVLAQSKPAADLIITNAKVWTVDPARPQAQAVAILGDRIVAVGSAAEVDAWRGEQTKIIDAGGKLVLPGFDDAHVHFVSGGMTFINIDLNDATSPQELTRRIAERARTMPKGEWMQGGDWDETKWNPAALPTAAMIDAVTADTPVFLYRYDGHAVLVNSLAMKLAGITSKTPDPPGGVIERDPKGNPTGVFKDGAILLIAKVVPPYTAEQRLAAARRAMAHAVSLGVTSVQDMNPDLGDLAAYSELLEKGEAITRIYAAPHILSLDDQITLGLRHAFGGPWLRLGAVKAYADGSLGSRTAYMFEPFSDQPGNRGLLAPDMHPLSAMRDRMMKADAAGLQICTHAIGDAGISTTLDLYADVVAAHGDADRRLRIEHAQHMAEKDFDRFAKLHVIASVQPSQTIEDGRFAEPRIGHDRASRTYDFRTFLNHGVHLAFGTDWDVEPLDPMLGLSGAVTRAPRDGKMPGGWFPEQKLTVAESIEAYTLGSAYAEFQDKVKGSITPGKLADMVILSDDLFSIPAEHIRDVKVLTTIVGGKVVYQAGK